MPQQNNLQKWQPLINQTAQKYGLDPNMIGAVIMRESSGNQYAANKGSSAAGLGQITDDTWKDAGYTDKDDKFDPAKNIDAIGATLSRHSKAFGGDPQKMLLAYNQGAGGARTILSGKASPEQVKAGQDYLNNSYFKPFVDTTKQIANPVSQLSQAPKPLIGGALLGATGGQAPTEDNQQYQQQVINSEVNNPAQMMTPEQQEQMRTRLELEAQRKAALEEAKKQSGLANGAIGLAALLYGANRDNSVTTSTQSAPGRAGAEWSAPTQQAIRGLRSFNNYQGG